MEAVGRVQKAQGGWAGPFNNYPNNFQIPPNFEIQNRSFPLFEKYTNFE
jgi:hypothetical protein